MLWQEALLKLGFYSGEEDMEFSSFSSGTERAVKTWQVSVVLHNICSLDHENKNSCVRLVFVITGLFE